ncbi:MAG: hypothetical protein NTX22_10765 [Ignavibacteriales bacterium]|nr:hypothetical protein [Ignavibacteriales bacterium]
MGFSTLIDLLGSIVVGGLLFLILLRMNDTATANTYVYGGELLVQKNLVAVVQLIQYDFRKIGYCANQSQIDPIRSILQADSTSIKFVTDLASPGHNFGDGIMDTLRYYLGPTSELTGTPNPYDRKLYRVVNSETARSSNLGITHFYITYFNSLGDSIPCPIASPGEIQTMQIDLKIENTAVYNQRNVYERDRHESQYTSAFWRQIRLAARNLRNR